MHVLYLCFDDLIFDFESFFLQICNHLDLLWQGMVMPLFQFVDLIVQQLVLNSQMIYSFHDTTPCDRCQDKKRARGPF